ncbi:MAG: dienelactone hydrolase family protein [Rhodobacteraceae bacterium]|nr:dienelactone hydrolase family protein [Paracoccaceae bacterium]
MARELKFGRKPARSGEARSLVVFLHGYGADGADLLGLADPLAPHLPNTVFVAPDAPERCAASPFGYQWFPIPWLDGSSEEAARTGLLAAATDLNAFLDTQLQAEGLRPDQMAVIGFSQGTMMALHVLPRCKDKVAGIVAFSGRLLRPELLAVEALSKPDVLLVHGDEDQVVPFGDMSIAGQALTDAGFTTFGHVMKGTGHGIAPDGLSVALAFLRDRIE